jgi:hypothetical protein
MEGLNSTGNDSRMQISGRQLSQWGPKAEVSHKWSLGDLHKIKWDKILKARDKYTELSVT